MRALAHVGISSPGSKVGSKCPFTLPAEGRTSSSNSSSSSSSFEDEANFAVIGTIGGILAGIVASVAAVIFISCRSIKSHAIFVLVLTALNVLVSIVSIFTLVGIPAFVITIIATVLVVPGSSIVACGCCPKADGSPCGYIACGVSCLLSFILRLAALVISVLALFVILGAAVIASAIIPGAGGAVVGCFCIVLPVASALAEILLSIRCFWWQILKSGAGTVKAGADTISGAGESAAAQAEITAVVKL